VLVSCCCSCLKWLKLHGNHEQSLVCACLISVFRRSKCLGNLLFGHTEGDELEGQLLCMFVINSSVELAVWVFRPHADWYAVPECVPRDGAPGAKCVNGSLLVFSVQGC
jgi:hypothetical protein